MRMKLPVLVGLALLFGTGCEPDQEASLPAPKEVTREVSGYFCGMIVADHPGPKGQVYIGESSEPIWFPSVRDTIAFLMLPGEQKNVRATYVNDMGLSPDWETPVDGSWITAEKAWFVLGSSKRGGMGQSEAVPFGTREGADAFVERFGGQVARLSEVPPDYIFGDDQGEHDVGDSEETS